MDFDHSPDCFHCRQGCTHPHRDGDPLDLPPGIGIAAPGSQMRRGGTFRCENSGIEIASDDWRRVRCKICGTEAMTPVEMLPPLGLTDPDGAHQIFCMPCVIDVRAGRRPGTTRRQARRRSRHRHAS